MGKIVYQTQYFIVILLLFISISCAKYGEYSSKCGNEPETALEGLYKAYAIEDYDQDLHYLSRADAKYYRDIRAKHSEENNNEGFDINSYLAKNTTWKVENKNINNDGTAQMTILMTQPNIGKAFGETIVDVMVDVSACESEDCISQSLEKLNPSAIIKDKGPLEFVTAEEEYNFVCEDNLWKVDFNAELSDKIDDEIMEAMRLYSKKGKMDEALRKLNKIPNKYEINKYQKEKIVFILGSINGIHNEIFEAYRLYDNKGNRDEAVKKLEEIRIKYKNDRYDEGLLDMILDDIKKEEAEKEIMKDQWNKG